MYQVMPQFKSAFSTKNMIRVSLLVAISFIFRLVDFPLPLFPDFLKMDLSDIPAIIAVFSVGVWAGVIVELLKNFLVFIMGMSSSAGIGELANFLVGIAYTVPLGIFYYRYNGSKKLLKSLIIGSIGMVFFASVLNYFMFIPLFANFYGMPISKLVQMYGKLNPLINDLKTVIIYCIVPWNIIKAIVISLLGAKLYDVVKKVIK